MKTPGLSRDEVSTGMERSLWNWIEDEDPWIACFWDEISGIDTRRSLQDWLQDEAFGIGYEMKSWGLGTAGTKSSGLVTGRSLRDEIRTKSSGLASVRSIWDGIWDWVQDEVSGTGYRMKSLELDTRHKV